MTGLGVRDVASQSLPSVRQLSGAATGVFSGEGKGGTGGGLTVFVGVGLSMGAFAGLGLDGGFVGLGEVGVTGASGAGGLETLQPMFWGSRHVSRSAASSCATEGPRVEWHVCVVARSTPLYAVRIQSGQLKSAASVLHNASHAGITKNSRRWPP